MLRISCNHGDMRMAIQMHWPSGKGGIMRTRIPVNRVPQRKKFVILILFSWSFSYFSQLLEIFAMPMPGSLVKAPGRSGWLGKAHIVVR